MSDLACTLKNLDHNERLFKVKTTGAMSVYVYEIQNHE